MKPKHFILTLLALFVSITASAYEWTDANGTVWSFTTSGGNAQLYKGWKNSCISGTIPADLSVPSKVYISETAYTVTSIGEYAFNNCLSLTSIVLPDEVTSIGNYAFAGCNYLLSIDLPDELTSIGQSAFSQCFSLTSIVLPDGVTSIGSSTFSQCNQLSTITIPDGVTSIGVSAFYQCFQLTTITIPNGVTSIEANAFYGCNHLETVYFASSTPKVTYDGWGNSPILYVPDAAVDAYKSAWPSYVAKIVPETSATYIYEATVEASNNSSAVVEAIGEANALYVVNLKVTGSINSYDVMVFRNKMLNLQNLDLSDATIVACNYKYYDNRYYTKDNVVTGYFGPSSLVSITLPNNITALDAYAFYDCQKLTSITIPESVVSIGSYAFCRCCRLQSATLPSGITEIPSYAFSACWALNTINLPNDITFIGSNAFSNCSSLTTINLPKGLKTIDDAAFQGCSGLTQIKLPPYIESMGSNAFNNCGNLNDIYVYIPDYTLSVNETAFSTYTTATLKIPAFLYKDYYYNEGGWKRFLNIVPCDLQPGDYESLPTNSDTSIEDNDEIIPNISENNPIDGEIFEQGSITVTDNVTDTQEFDEVIQYLDGEGQGGSLIGTNTNLSANTLRVKINVKAGRWYFFCFPYDVTIANCEYPGQYAWRWYDGAERATNGSGGWKPVTGETLTAFEGYAFQTSHTGNLIISFNHPTFGGDRPKTLVAHASANAANASWNLVGNPYSSFYDFLAVDFDAPITVYNSNGTYSAYRPADDECHLQPYEAFFVQKPTEVDAINFDSDRRESYNQGQTKKAERQKARRARGIDPQRQLINLEILCGEKQADRTRVVLNEQKSRDYELDCDASKFLSNEATAQLYTIENGIKMAINERPMEGDIRLGYTAKQAGTLSISASRMDMPMMLFDTQLGITFDLSVGTYDFETQAGTFNDRFELRLSGDATAIKSMKEKTGVCFGTQDGGISIGGAEGKTINVYTTDGKMAAQHSGNGYIALKSGVYVVNVDGVTAKVSVK